VYEVFEMVSAPLKGLPLKVIIEAFKNILKEEIKAKLRLQKLHNLSKIIEIA